MAFCRNCGAELPEGGKFCVKCGAPVPSGNGQTPDMQPETQGTDTAPEQGSFTAPEQGSFTAPEQGSFTASGQNGYAAPDGQYVTPQGGYGASAKPEPSPEEKKKKNKKIITIAVIAFVAVAVIVAAIIIIKNILDKQATKRKTIDLSEYITVEFDGYDTMGRADIEVNKDEFVDKVLYAMKASEKNDKAVDKAEELYGSIYAYSDTDIDLSNGDKIEISASWSKEAVRKAGVILKFKEYEVEVSGLDKIKVVDPFEFADVQFTGVDGNVSVNVENTSTDKVLSSITFYPSSYYGLSKGDTVTVTASYNSYTLLNEYGIKIEPEEKTYTVDNVDTYDVNAADIKKDFIDSLSETSVKEINDSYSYSSYKISDMNYAGFYLLKAKKENEYPQNAIFVIYKGTATKNDETKEVFLPVQYYPVIGKADGTVYLDSDYASLQGYSDGLSGYVSEKAMFDDIVIDNSDDYEAFLSDGMRDFSGMVPSEDGSNVSEIPWNYHYSDAVDELIEHGLFENISQFNIADYVSSDNISDNEHFLELMNIILRTLSKDETAKMDAVGPVAVDKSVTWFYFERDGVDYKLVFDGSGTQTSGSKETAAENETDASQETSTEEVTE